MLFIPAYPYWYSVCLSRFIFSNLCLYLNAIHDVSPCLFLHVHVVYPCIPFRIRTVYPYLPILTHLSIHVHPFESTLFLHVYPFIPMIFLHHIISYPPGYLIQVFWLACSQFHLHALQISCCVPFTSLPVGAAPADPGRLLDTTHWTSEPKQAHNHETSFQTSPRTQPARRRQNCLQRPQHP
jgi:hypothetical protein